MSRRRALPAGLPLAALAAVVLVLLPTLLAALVGAAGPDATGDDAAALVSAAPVAAGPRTASLADAVRLEAWAPAPGADAATPLGTLAVAPPAGDAALGLFPFPSPAVSSRRL